MLTITEKGETVQVDFVKKGWTSIKLRSTVVGRPRTLYNIGDYL